MENPIAPEVDNLEAVKEVISLVHTMHETARMSLATPHRNFYWNVGRHTVTCYQHVEVSARWTPRVEIWIAETNISFSRYFYECSIQNADVYSALDQILVESYKWLETLKEMSDELPIHTA